MTIDVANLLNKRKTKIEVHLVYEERPFYDEGEIIAFNKPIEVEGEIYTAGDILTLEGTISTELNLPCSRCLSAFMYAITLPIHERFSNISHDEDDEIIFIEGDSIEITDIVKNNIVLSLPIKKLCSDDCKGLCQHCGKNLNISTCNCGNDIVDPRLEKLKDMFSAR
jgi:uncharacterized protein